MGKRNLLIESLERRQMLSISLVKDINATPALNTGFKSSVTAGSIVYLSQDDAASGVELWKTDGTTIGTVRVKDINAGAADSYPTSLTMVGTTLYFAGNDGTHGIELWKSDGTSNGTVQVKDINGAGSSNPTGLTNVNGVLYFAANDGTNGIELWKSDGTSNGTTMIKNIAGNSASSSPTSLCNNNGTLYFAANDGTTGIELWKSNGTSGGTVQVMDINSGPGDSNPGSIVARGGWIWFAATTAASGREIWDSDGLATTQQIKDVNAGAANLSPQNLIVSSSYVYFTSEESGVAGLYRTDGVSTGTIKLTTITPGPYPYPRSMVDMNGKLFFNFNGAVYSTTGAAGSVTAVSPPGQPNQYNALAASNGTLYFALLGVDPFKLTYELYSSLGTAATTTKISNFISGAESSDISAIMPIGAAGGCVLVSDATGGGTLYKSDGTLASTVAIKDIFTGTGDAIPLNPVALNGSLIFGAVDGVSGARASDYTTYGEPYVSDGTSAGTSLIADVFAGAGGSNARGFTAYSGRVYFRADDFTHGDEIWSTDGTAAGTSLLKDIYNLDREGSNSFLGDEHFATDGNFLYFGADDGTGGSGLYRTNGTTAGTIPITGGPSAQAIQQLTNVNGVVYYICIAGSGGVSLRKVSGATSVLVSSSIAPLASLTNVNGTLFFNGGTTLPARLCKTSGTTSIVSTNVSDPTNLTNVGGKLFFCGTGSSGDVELYKSDGTSGGTVVVKNINPSGSSNPSSLVNVNGILYFSADDGVHGVELWRSDGTDAGTYRLTDIASGLAGANIQSITAAYGSIYFTADDGVHGAELWRSDGTPAGNVMLGEVFIGNDFSYPPTAITPCNGAVYFSAYDPTYGTELRKVDAPSFATLAGNVVAINGTLGDDIVHVSISGGMLTVNLNGLTQTFSAAGLTGIVFNALDGGDNLNLDSALAPAITFNAGIGNDALSVNAGSATFNYDLSTISTKLTLNVAAGATVTLGGNQHIAAMNVAGNLIFPASGSSRVVTSALSVTGTLDLNDNDMIVDYATSSPMSSIVNLIRTARNGGTWNLPGMTSTSALQHAKHSTTLGTMEAGEYKLLNPLNTSFDNEAIDNTAVLIKYTYYGDANFNGKVDGGDYARVDSSYANQSQAGNISGWINGDFDGNGKVDGGDYGFIAWAFATQSGIL